MYPEFDLQKTSNPCLLFRRPVLAKAVSMQALFVGGTHGLGVDI